jgi:hypothetical protein
MVARALQLVASAMMALGAVVFVLGCQTIFGVDPTGGVGGGGAGAAGDEGGCGNGVCDESEDCLDCKVDCARSSCDDDLEVNNESLQATEIEGAAEQCGLGICHGDVDWFALDVPTDTHVRIRYDTSQGDLDLEVYDKNYVDGSYTEGVGEDKVPLGGLASGRYAARVYGKSNDDTIENTCYCVRIAEGE